MLVVGRSCIMASELKVDKFTGVTTKQVPIDVTVKAIVQQLICNKGWLKCWVKRWNWNCCK